MRYFVNNNGNSIIGGVNTMVEKCGCGAAAKPAAKPEKKDEKSAKKGCK
jgi:hypothetical protein